MWSAKIQNEPAGFQKRVWSAVAINLENATDQREGAKGVVIFVFALEKKNKICEPTAGKELVDSL